MARLGKPARLTICASQSTASRRDLPFAINTHIVSQPEPNKTITADVERSGIDARAPASSGFRRPGYIQQSIGAYCDAGYCTMCTGLICSDQFRPQRIEGPNRAQGVPSLPTWKPAARSQQPGASSQAPAARRQQPGASPRNLCPKEPGGGCHVPQHLPFPATHLGQPDGCAMQRSGIDGRSELLETVC